MQKNHWKIKNIYDEKNVFKNQEMQKDIGKMRAKEKSVEKYKKCRRNIKQNWDRNKKYRRSIEKCQQV